MTGISFGRPLLLLALPLVPVVFALWWHGRRSAAVRARAISRQAPRGPRVVPALLLGLAAGAALLSAAQPRWGAADSAVRREATDVVIVLDVSRSMAARDIAPSRLEAAKTAIAQTLDRLAGDRAGLVVFGGSSRLRFPLTPDLGAAARVVQSLEAGPVFVQGGTDTASGLDIALGAFPASGRGGKLILLISDGENLGPDPAAAAARVRASGASLLVAGAGTAAGAHIPVFDAARSQFADKAGADGQPLVSKLNEPFLQALAAAAGGRYLGPDLAAVPGVVAGRVTALQRARVEDRQATIPIERFQWFAAAALALLLLATLVERLPGLAHRPAAFAPLVALLGLALGGCSERAFDLNEQGRNAYAAGDYGRAIDLFYEAQTRRPAAPAIALNLAAALDRAGRFGEATDAARRALLAPRAEDRARAYASIGHHQFGAGQLDAALDAFKQALLLDPGNGDARHDYEVVLRLLGPKASEQDSGNPGDAPDAQPGDPGSKPQPGDQNNPPGGQPGGTAQPGSGGGSNQGADPKSIERRLNEIDREVESILAQSQDAPSPSDALRILELLAERSRIAAQRGALGGSPDPNDY